MTPRRIIMWSPPRARSTLMMRVFEALGCAVFDEPFYAAWLKARDKRDDPGFAQTLAAHPQDPAVIIDQVLGPVPGQADWFYQKHMAIHMLPEFPLDWMAHPEVVNCFLIRDPREVIVSMTEFRDLAATGFANGVDAAAELVGIPQLARIYAEAERVAATPPPVIDANDVLRDPAGTLGAFCAAIGMPFDPTAPIRWAPGQHEADGAWAPFWYEKVFATSGLEPWQGKATRVPDELRAVVDACVPTYEALYERRLTGSTHAA